MTEPDDAVEARIAARLSVVAAGGGTVDGIPLPPPAYVRRHLVEHAAAGEVLADVLTPALLPYLDARQLRSLAAERAGRGWRSDLFRAWRRVAHRWNYDRPAVNAVLLRLACLDVGLPADERLVGGAWIARWASWPADVGEVVGSHGGPVTAAAVAVLDGRPVVVSGSQDRTVRVWDPLTGQPVGAPLTGHTGSVTAVAVTALDDRPVVLSGSRDRTVLLWDLASGRLLATLTGHRDAVTALAVTAVDGRPGCVSGSDDETIRLWDLVTREPAGKPMVEGNGRITSIAVVGSGPLAVVGSGNSTVRVWDLAARRSAGPALTAPASIAWPTQTGPHDNQPTPVAALGLATGGSIRPVALIGTGATVACRNIASGARVAPDLTGHHGAVTAIATVAGKSGPTVLTGSRDQTVRGWDLGTGTQIGQADVGHTGPVTALVPIPGTPLAVSGSTDGSLRVWSWEADLRTPGRRPAPRPASGSIDVVAAARIGDRPIVVTGERTGAVTAWDMSTGERPFPVVAAHPRPVSAITIATVGDLPVVLTGSHDRTLRAWTITTGAPFGEPCGGHTVRVTALAATVLDGRLVAVAAGYDPTPRVWDVGSGRQVGELVGHENVVTAVVTVEVDGRPVVVTGGADRTIRIWDLVSGSSLADPLTGHTGTVLTLATTSVDGRPVLVSGARDGCVRRWSLAGDPAVSPTGQVLGRHAGAVTAAATITTDSRAIAVTHGADDLVRLWDVATGDPVDEPLPAVGTVRGVATTDASPGLICLAGHGISVVELDEVYLR